VCTVSILRLGDDLIRLACNRDEQRSRPVALPPRVARINGRLAVMPIDPAGGGTWIAANDAGVIMALLNRNALKRQEVPAGGLLSRGKIIPLLIGCSSVDEAIQSASNLHPCDYGPFTLVLIDRDTRAHVISDGFEMRMTNFIPQDDAALFTSSGLGDHLVETPRRMLFEAMIESGGLCAGTQDCFHRHQWPERQQLSVCMRRRDAKTVSHTIIELRPEEIDLYYHAAAPDEPGSDCRTTLPLHKSVLS